MVGLIPDEFSNKLIIIIVIGIKENIHIHKYLNISCVPINNLRARRPYKNLKTKNVLGWEFLEPWEIVSCCFPIGGSKKFLF